MRILLDTNICIYIIKNKPPEVRSRFQQYDIGDIGVSTITVAELEYGVKKSAAVERNQKALETFLLPLEFLDFDHPAAQAYGDIRAALERNGTPIGGMDMLIAAQAQAHDLLLVTRNLREFQRVQGLRCESWAEKNRE